MGDTTNQVFFSPGSYKQSRCKSNVYDGKGHDSINDALSFLLTHQHFHLRGFWQPGPVNAYGIPTEHEHRQHQIPERTARHVWLADSESASDTQAT